MAKSFVKFTAQWLNSAASQGVPGKTTEYRDTHAPGLSLRVYPSGRRVYCAVGNVKGGGNTTRTVIGDVAKVPLEATREQCREIIAQWTLGKKFETDVARERRQDREAVEARRAAARETEQNKPLRFENVLDAYAIRHLLEMRSGRQTHLLLQREFGRLWLDRRIDQLKRSDVIGAITTIIDRGHIPTAKSALGGLKAMLAWAHARPEYGLIDAPCATDRVMFGGLVSKARRPKARERVLTDDELRTVWAAASSPKLAPPTGDLVKMLLLTALRLREAALMGRSEIGADGWLTIPPARMKQGKQHRVFLTPAAHAIIARRLVVGDYVFRRNDGPLRSFGSIKQQIDALIPGGMPHWTFHDLRRTARSNFSGLCPSDEPKDSKLRFSDTVCELAIAHRPSGIEGVYNKHQYRDELRLLFTRWEAHLLGIVGEPVPNVVPLRPRRSGVKACLVEPRGF
jgi:integrase